MPPVLFLLQLTSLFSLLPVIGFHFFGDLGSVVEIRFVDEPFLLKMLEEPTIKAVAVSDRMNSRCRPGPLYSVGKFIALTMVQKRTPVGCVFMDQAPTLLEPMTMAVCLFGRNQGRPFFNDFFAVSSGVCDRCDDPRRTAEVFFSPLERVFILRDEPFEVGGNEVTWNMLAPDGARSA